MSNYSRGRAFEYRIRKWYEGQGFDAFRSAGSHSPSDIIAIFHGQVIFNSLRTNNYWSPAEREEFESLVARHPGAIGRYVWRHGREICWREAK